MYVVRMACNSLPMWPNQALKWDAPTVSALFWLGHARPLSLSFGGSDMKAGIKTTARLRCLRPVLRKWIALNRQLGARWSSGGDVAWWYNERALISVFAGAVWQSGGYAFEEFSERKRGKKRLLSGRIDLEFTAGQHEFLAEVKQCELAATARRDRTDHVRGFMDKAKADVRRCRPDGRRRIAIVFGAPYVAKHRRAEMDDRIEWLVDQAGEIHDNIEADAVAWTFPSPRRLPTYQGWVCPGIIAWIREVRR